MVKGIRKNIFFRSEIGAFAPWREDFQIRIFGP